MKNILLLLVVILLNARENPFIPVITNNNKNLIKKTLFKDIKTNLPSDARVLKSITFTYQTLTGEIKNKTIIINQAINPNNPLYIAELIKKVKSKFIKMKFLKLYIKDYKLFIQTKDKMIRNFILVKPFRVIIDFKANKSFLTYKKKLNSFITKAILGNHDGFYRLVLYTNGVYKPIIKKTAEGYLIEFK